MSQTEVMSVSFRVKIARELGYWNGDNYETRQSGRKRVTVSVAFDVSLEDLKGALGTNLPV